MKAASPHPLYSARVESLVLSVSEIVKVVGLS